MVRAQINSEKHIVQVSPTIASFGANFAVPVVVATIAPAGNADEVRIGASVKAVYVELWVVGTDQQTSSTITTFEKLSSGATFATQSDMTALHAYANKKNIFKMHQGIIPDNNGNPVPFYREWIPIPKGKQRIGQGDQIVVNISGLTADVEFCGCMVYKEYF